MLLWLQQDIHKWGETVNKHSQDSFPSLFLELNLLRLSTNLLVLEGGAKKMEELEQMSCVEDCCLVVAGRQLRIISITEIMSNATRLDAE